MDNKAPEELTNAPHLCVCKDEMSGKFLIKNIKINYNPAS